MSLLCLLLDSILAPCSLPLAARACRSTAFQPPCIFILDKPLAGCTFFVPRSPCVPAAPAFPKPRRKPGSQAATGPLRGAGGAGMPPSGGKAAQTASQGQTAGNGLGGPLGPPAACSHRRFRPVILDNFLSMATRFLVSHILLRRPEPDQPDQGHALFGTQSAGLSSNYMTGPAGGTISSVRCCAL